jgi:3-deoxy-D-manno-octulosonate 8-phosphate phosphatase (KDO 8-P phosphatase)
VALLSGSELEVRARKVRMIAFDVDGVCTDGRLYYGPSGEMLHAFHARDGLGLVLARNAGIVLAAVSGRDSTHVSARMRELRVPHILQGIQRKADAVEQLLAQLAISFEELAYIGDDVNDLPVLRRAGLSACVADAADDVLPQVDYITRRRGGDAALRELIEIVLKAQGKWP